MGLTSCWMESTGGSRIDILSAYAGVGYHRLRCPVHDGAVFVSANDCAGAGNNIRDRYRAFRLGSQNVRVRSSALLELLVRDSQVAFPSWRSYHLAAAAGWACDVPGAYLSLTTAVAMARRACAGYVRVTLALKAFGLFPTWKLQRSSVDASRLAVSGLPLCFRPRS